MKKILSVIFDMDGVLLNTEPIYTMITQKVVGQFDKTFDWETKAKMIGRNNLEAARILVACLGLPICAEEFLDLQKEFQDEYFPQAEPLKGIPELVGHLHRQKIPIAVATSSSRRLFQLKTSRHLELFSQFKAVVAGDDEGIARAKPAPDIFLAAAAKLKVAPASCLVIEDAPTGVEAAVAAGMSVVAIPDSHMDQNLYAGASEILSSILELDLKKWGLPEMARDLKN